MPIGFSEDGAVLLAMADPTNVLTVDDVAMMTGRRIRPAAASLEDLNLLLTAALVHDLGRTREFAYDAEVTRTQEGVLLGHLALGLRVIDAHAPAHLDEARRLALEHCLMLHHGPREGASAGFAAAEAVALFRLNSLDAAVKGAFEHHVAARADR